ncbi:hypothetical protein DFH06DRAFT_1139800 [Mycena polygramma]|nr:hypothetical protein DFH06DRAFT_1139800 [Mycena polygramma]
MSHLDTHPRNGNEISISLRLSASTRNWFSTAPSPLILAIQGLEDNLEPKGNNSADSDIYFVTRRNQMIHLPIRAAGRDEGPALFRHLGTSLFHCLTLNTARINKHWNGRLDPNLGSIKSRKIGDKRQRAYQKNLPLCKRLLAHPLYGVARGATLGGVGAAVGAAGGVAFELSWHVGGNAGRSGVVAELRAGSGSAA